MPQEVDELFSQAYSRLLSYSISIQWSSQGIRFKTITTHYPVRQLIIYHIFIWCNLKLLTRIMWIIVWLRYFETIKRLHYKISFCLISGYMFYTIKYELKKGGKLANNTLADTRIFIFTLYLVNNCYKIVMLKRLEVVRKYFKGGNYIDIVRINI